MGRARQGMTLIEILIVLAIMGMLLLVSVPAISSLLSLEQSGAAKELGLTYKYLRDEAALRNVTFRVAFNLDARTYKVEVGDASTVIFTTPEEREDYEEELAEQLGQGRSSGGEPEEDAADNACGGDGPGRFEGISDPAFETEKSLPNGSFFAWVWTPQYEEPVEPSDEELDDPAEAKIVYSYIFPNGTAEYTLVRIAAIDDPEDGYTVEVEPMSGRVTVHGDVLSPEDAKTWDANDAPSLEF